MRPSRRNNLLHLYWILPLLLLAGFSGVGLVMLVQWLEGGECRSLIERKSTEQLHATTRLAPLHWDFSGLSSESLKALGSETTALKSIASSRLHARIRPSGLLQGTIVVEEIALDKITLHLGPASKPVVQQLVSEAKADPVFPRWIPTRTVIEVVRGASADVYIDLQKGTSFAILGTRLDIHPENDQVRFESRGGTLTTDHFPDLKFDIETVRCRLSKKGLDITGADLRFAEGGKMRIEGYFPSEIEGGDSKLKGHWENVSIGPLLPALGGNVTGSLEGESEAFWTRKGLRELRGSISAHEATVSRVPMLDKLADFTGMEQFRHLPVQEAHADFSGDSERTEWRNIILESKELIKLTGEAVVTMDGSLKGSFQVGITRKIVDIIPFAREILGLNEHDGYIWTPMKVEGTLSHPKEDLTPRLAMAVTARAEGLLKSGLQDALNMLGIKKTDGTAPDKGTNATNAVKTLEEGAGATIHAIESLLK
jgi:hypothetical protein